MLDWKHGCISLHSLLSCITLTLTQFPLCPAPRPALAWVGACPGSKPGKIPEHHPICNLYCPRFKSKAFYDFIKTHERKRGKKGYKRFLCNHKQMSVLWIASSLWILLKTRLDVPGCDQMRPHSSSGLWICFSKPRRPRPFYLCFLLLRPAAGCTEVSVCGTDRERDVFTG